MWSLVFLGAALVALPILHHAAGHICHLTYTNNGSAVCPPHTCLPTEECDTPFWLNRTLPRLNNTVVNFNTLKSCVKKACNTTISPCPSGWKCRLRGHGRWARSFCEHDCVRLPWQTLRNLSIEASGSGERTLICQLKFTNGTTVCHTSNQCPSYAPCTTTTTAPPSLADLASLGIDVTSFKICTAKTCLSDNDCSTGSICVSGQCARHPDCKLQWSSGRPGRPRRH